MVTPVSISNYISLPDDFPVRNIAPQVKEVLKDFIDALSTIICNEEWRTSLNINSATKKIFNNLDNLSYIQRTSFRGNDTLYNEKVQFKLTYPARNGRHKENIEFQVVINLSPIYLDNFRHDGEINIFCAPNPKPVTMGRVFQTGVERVLFLFLNDFIEQFPMINLGVPIKRAHTPHIEPLPPDHHTAADYLRQFDLLVLNFISRGNFVILPRLWSNSEVHRWFVNKDPNLITAILDITDGELKEDLLQSLMDSLGSNKHVLPEVCICFLSLLAEQESPHFQDFFLYMVNQKKDRLLNEYLSPLDITAAQFKVLCSIRCAACITPVELKKVLSVDLGALTRMLDRLVCKGWVERLPNPNDKRGVLVKLTTSGAAICEQCHQLVGQDLHQELTKNLTADEVATLEHLLKKVLP